MDVRPHPTELFRLFRDDAPPHAAEVAGADLPEPYRRLLVHRHHMTVTVEQFVGGPVTVRVLNRRHDGDTYSRMIVLEHGTPRRVVQFGIVRIRLGDCSAQVRSGIMAEAVPLGRVLIEHNVLRRVKPVSYLRVETGPVLSPIMDLTASHTTYGRTGIIFCDGRPAIELLEILAPVESDVTAGEPHQTDGRDDKRRPE